LTRRTIRVDIKLHTALLTQRQGGEVGELGREEAQCIVVHSQSLKSDEIADARTEGRECVVVQRQALEPYQSACETHTP
jgi:hypothetical protein